MRNESAQLLSPIAAGLVGVFAAFVLTGCSDSEDPGPAATQDADEVPTVDVSGPDQAPVVDTAGLQPDHDEAPPAVDQDIPPGAPESQPDVAEALPKGFNLALAELGGKIEHVSAQYSEAKWAAEHLIDGFPRIRDPFDSIISAGWSSGQTSLPIELVFSFHEGREAVLGGVIFDTATETTLKDTSRVPRRVEIWTSTTAAESGYSMIAEAELRRAATVQSVSFPPSPAKYLKLVITENHGGKSTQLGEVQIIETAEQGQSILEDVPMNLAHRALGGRVVWFSSQDPNNPAAELVDGQVSGTTGWLSDFYLPQEIVFAFEGDRSALLDQLVLDPNSGPSVYSSKRPQDAWPKTVFVAVSDADLRSGFTEVGQFTLRQEAGEQSFPIGRRARFVKLRIIENYGDRRTNLGEVKFIEGRADEYESVLLAAAVATDRSGTGPETAADQSFPLAPTEVESNDSDATANPIELGGVVAGSIDPVDDQDFFSLTIPGEAEQVLTLEQTGYPFPRTTTTLIGPDGQQRKQVATGNVLAAKQVSSWLVTPGDLLLQMTEASASTVLIWDSSSSMGGKTRDLQSAVESYLQRPRANERLALIRFSGKPETLLTDFANNNDEIRTAIEGQFVAEGSTALYDAVSQGIDLLEDAGGNRTIIVFSDGADTASRMKTEAFWRKLRDHQVRLYTIGLGEQLRTYDLKTGSTGRRMLKHMGMMTHGKFHYAPNSEELKRIYEGIAAELSTPSMYSFRARLSRGPGHLVIDATGERIPAMSAPSRIELILDASGSMKRSIAGRAMIDIAKDVLQQVVQGLPDDIEVGVRVYGHRVVEGQPGDCTDSELIVPFGKINKNTLIRRIRGIQALGTTPMAYSLQQVAQDFGNATGEKMLILVTDGKEECGGSPATVVAELLEQGLQMHLNVVGFALTDDALKAEMQQIAEMTDGRFIDATNAADLKSSIKQALALPFRVRDASGETVAGGWIGGGPIPLHEGTYTVEVQKSDEPLIIRDVKVVYENTTRIELIKEGKEIGVIRGLEAD